MLRKQYSCSIVGVAVASRELGMGDNRSPGPALVFASHRLELNVGVRRVSKQSTLFLYVHLLYTLVWCGSLCIGRVCVPIVMFTEYLHGSLVYLVLNRV